MKIQNTNKYIDLLYNNGKFSILKINYKNITDKGMCIKYVLKQSIKCIHKEIINYDLYIEYRQ